MNSPITRRTFLKQSSALTAGLAAAGALGPWRAVAGANDKVRVGVMGCNSRGMKHISGFMAAPNTEVAYICDVDSRAVEKGLAAALKGQSVKPKGITDFRHMLDDPGVDAISIATPDHWHAPATILACAAGKHVYVEKPGSHNGEEIDWVISAARRHKRVVQMGNQRRSWPWVIEAITALHEGELGKLFFARAWYTNHRPSIGHGKLVPAPEWLDYALWQGPAPESPYRDNFIHYNWRWFWNWGTGELGNNGVHALDLARWGLQVDYPKRVTCGGNRYHFDDDWQSPDIYVAMFDYGNAGIAWEGQSCDPHGFEGAGFGVNFYGEKGSMALTDDHCVIYDLKDKPVREIKTRRDDVLHFANFADAIRGNAALNSEIEEGQKATLLCHLGNIAWRSGRTVDYDPVARKMANAHSFSDLWRREYRPGWKPKV